ncbi:hypothetical protein [Plasticicumulans sp.]|uniref:hypothetical protein n=1 Tax=Plasticicumulans sp. TaxID=2307179 RepID=UPI00322019E9
MSADPIDYRVQQSVIVTVTAELVEWLLAMNTHNRSVRPTHVNLLAEVFRRREWWLTNQGIGISKDGRVIDGQHRLLALRAAGYPPIQILIVTGLDARSQIAVDRHTRRRTSDTLALFMGKTVSDRATAAISAVMRMRPTDSGGYSLGRRITDGEVIEALVEYEAELERLLPLVRTLRAGVTAGLIDYARRWSLDDAAVLTTQLRDGEGLQANDPAYRLRDYMLRSRRGNGGGGLMVVDYSLTVRACIAHARREPLKLLRPGLTWDALPPDRPSFGSLQEHEK